ncbi:hypothetical protein Glo7428_3153 [Gloeocapsa sp. PCC 7428]|uniref:hypothetical protein n=1 Tax=Gloeocapsa sp. PCC 7428 TaxID=1173026 RepID=UPI0002A5DC00|nr:hypothetical protein [Gloeocapsa sp. PCC 7428]AFZ31640.1 hypothetical protein Glo7428_3153 [Gloeocapsa sp. PCC 7428]
MLNNVESIKTARELLLPFDRASNRRVVLNSNTSTQVMPTNLNRAYMVITNTTNEPVTLLLGEGNAELNRGIILTARGSSFEITQNNLFVGRIAAIAASAAEISVVECSF